ncbi:MAG: hypothetical protein WCD89_13545 [Anaerocolumna sp.]
MNEKGLVVGGYLFSTNKDYNDAEEEQESIHFLCSKTDLSNPVTALKLYNKLIENRTFHTVVAFAFLKELQETILNSGIVKAEDLEGIYIPAQIDNNEVDILTFEKYKLQAERQKVRIRNSRIINIFLVFTILAMIIIAIYSDKTMYTNFENKVIDRYSSWEDELNNREQDLTKREEALGQSKTRD